MAKKLLAFIMALSCVFSLLFCVPASAVHYQNGFSSGESRKAAASLAVKLSATTYEYTGSAITPKVKVTYGGKTLKNGTDYTVGYTAGRKNVGRYSVKVTLKGRYKGTKTVYFYIVPKKPTILSVTAGNKSVTVKWKAVSAQADGYILEYSTSSSFKNAKSVAIKGKSTTSRTLSGLANGQKYYFRLKAYKIVSLNGKYVTYRSYASAARYAVPSAATGQQITVIINKSSKVFHVSSSCSAVKRMSAKNKGTMKGTVSQIKAAGYKPCGICAKKYK